MLALEQPHLFNAGSTPDSKGDILSRIRERREKMKAAIAKSRGNSRNLANNETNQDYIHHALNVES